jgi:hypothetical protein
MKNKITKSQFLAWYFSDSDDIESLGHRAYECLSDDGEFHINVQDLFNECGYIPQEQCEDNTGDDEYDPSEVELING